MSSLKRLANNLSEQGNYKNNVKNVRKYKKSSGVIEETVIVYIEENNKIKHIEEMKRGYVEMARLNLEISEMGIKSDNEDMRNYELKLSESDMPDDNDGEKRRYILC